VAFVEGDEESPTMPPTIQPERLAPRPVGIRLGSPESSETRTPDPLPRPARSAEDAPDPRVSRIAGVHLAGHAADPALPGLDAIDPARVAPSADESSPDDDPSAREAEPLDSDWFDLPVPGPVAVEDDEPEPSLPPEPTPVAVELEPTGSAGPATPPVAAPPRPAASPVPDWAVWAALALLGLVGMFALLRAVG
jgi:hypothetical protein